MISKDTILSIFNEKGTLLKWLQKLEKALKNDTLTGVTISQPTTTQAVLTFTFKDGTTLDSAVIDLPSGAPGINGTNGIDGKDGAPGKNGNGIVSINSEASYVSGNDTITPITIETDDSTEHITVSARNGTDGTNGINGTNGTDGAIHALGTHNLTGPDGNSYRLSEIFSANGILKPGQIVLFRGDKTENGKLYKYVGERNLLESGWKPWNAADWEYEGNLRGDQGQPGNDGVGIESITTLGYRAGTGANVGYTETMLKAHMTNNIDKNLSVFAKDGIDNTQQLLTDIRISNTGKYKVFAEKTNNYGFTYNDTGEPFKAKKIYLTNSSDTSSQSISISNSGATVSSSKILYCVEKGRFLTNSELLEKSETLTLIVFQKENLTIMIN